MEASKKTEKAKEEAKHVPKENESKKKNLRQARRGRRNPWNEHSISNRRAQRVHHHSCYPFAKNLARA